MLFTLCRRAVFFGISLSLGRPAVCVGVSPAGGVPQLEVEPPLTRFFAMQASLSAFRAAATTLLRSAPPTAPSHVRAATARAFSASTPAAGKAVFCFLVSFLSFFGRGRRKKSDGAAGALFLRAARAMPEQRRTAFRPTPYASRPSKTDSRGVGRVVGAGELTCAVCGAVRDGRQRPRSNLERNPGQLFLSPGPPAVPHTCPHTHNSHAGQDQGGQPGRRHGRRRDDAVRVLER